MCTRIRLMWACHQLIFRVNWQVHRGLRGRLEPSKWRRAGETVVRICPAVAAGIIPALQGMPERPDVARENHRGHASQHVE